MTALELLLHRQSNGFLTSPAPNETQLQQIMAAARAVPDHAGLAPFKFHIISGDGLIRLSEIYVEACKAKNTDQLKIDKATKMAFRAPMTIVISSKFKDHPKVPVQEQLVTAGCASQAIQMAAQAQGYGTMWRTGDMAYSNIVKSGLNIDTDEEIVGFLYIGTESKQLAVKKRKDAEQFIERWC